MSTIRDGVLPSSTDAKSPFDAFIGVSGAIKQALGLARRLAASPVRCVLITGEAGTGKELLARCIHNSSQNANAPFVSIGCAAMPAGLVEVELFGQEGGSNGNGTPA